jgi:nicotinate-nucleotide adenylyltransferase
MKIGLFFGSFNPIHVGHLIIANYLAEYTDMKQIWFIVSPQNPFKEKESLLNEYHRLDLVNTAIEGNNKLKSSDNEFKLPKPSYTIDTLQYLKEKYPKKQFCLIMGSDNVTSFHKWKNYETILNQYPIYVYKRNGDEHLALQNKYPQINFLDVPLLDVSSSLIRKMIREKKSVRYLLPENVHEQVMKSGYYKS